LSQTSSGHAAVAGNGREESADLRSMRMWDFRIGQVAGSGVIKPYSRLRNRRYRWGAGRVADFSSPVWHQ
jgi:hypothetical protein